jgi:hypothetical protein
MGVIWAGMPSQYFPGSGSLPGFGRRGGPSGDHGDFPLDF